MATKTTPDLTRDTHLRTAINTDLFESYGGISKPPGSKRVLSSQLMEAGSPASISWVGFYKAADLNGQILRHVLISGGTQLYKVESDGSLTQLTGTGKAIGNRTAGLVHASQNVEDFLFIQNQDPDLVGRGDDPVKYDGKDITLWGILPPGSQPTVVENFSASSSFTTSGISSIADETVTTRDGGATKISTGTSQVNGDLEKTISTSPDITITDRESIFIYIPRGELSNFSDTTSTPAVNVRIGNNLTTDYYDFNFSIGTLQEGWNELFLNYANRLNNDTDSTTDDPNVDIVGTPTIPFTAARFRVNSKTASTAITGIVWDLYSSFDKGALTAAEGTAGTALKSGGKYKYKVTYVGKTGHESNASPESVLIELSAARDDINLTEIPISPDPQVIARKIYRTVAGGEIFLFLDRIEDNTTTTYTDTTSDLGLGQTSPPLAGDVSDDNSPPTKAGIVKLWKRTVFLAGFPDRPEVVGFSEDDEPESFPTLNEVQLDAKVTAIYETYSGLVVETEVGKWQVTGDNPDFQFDKVINNIGCVGRRAAGETRIAGWAIDREGMRLYDLNNPQKISEVIRDKFDTEFNKENLELIQSSHSKSRNCIMMLVADENGEYKGNNYCYQYPLDQVDSGWWWELQLPTTINPLHFQEIEDSDGTFKLYFGADDGMLYEVFCPTEKNWSRADGSTEAITTEWQSKYIRLASQGERGEAYEGRALPRLFELRYDGDTPSSWEVTVDTANGSSQPTPTATSEFYVDFDSNQSLIRRPIKITQPAEYVRIKVKNEEKNVAGTVTGIRIYFRPQPGQFPIETGQMTE
ncbi:MAG: hypothetical protein SVK08_00890 [Halobacteriota archaeon]|nr:hypothetical protein [Halobacteriota archaeon]